MTYILSPLARQNLTIAEKFLRSIPESAYPNFQLQVWQRSQFIGGERLYPDYTFTGNFECGFAGCAIGWIGHAKVIPGLRMVKGTPYFEVADPDEPDKRDWQAVESAFDITERVASWLFTSTAYDLWDEDNKLFDGDETTPVMVADRIQGLLDGTIQPPGAL